MIVVFPSCVRFNHVPLEQRTARKLINAGNQVMIAGIKDTARSISALLEADFGFSCITNAQIK